MSYQESEVRSGHSRAASFEVERREPIRSPRAASAEGRYDAIQRPNQPVEHGDNKGAAWPSQQQEKPPYDEVPISSPIALRSSVTGERDAGTYASSRHQPLRQVRCQQGCRYEFHDARTARTMGQSTIIPADVRTSPATISTPSKRGTADSCHYSSNNGCATFVLWGNSAIATVIRGNSSRKLRSCVQRISVDDFAFRLRLRSFDATCPV